MSVAVIKENYNWYEIERKEDSTTKTRIKMSPIILDQREGSKPHCEHIE